MGFQSSDDDGRARLGFLTDLVARRNQGAAPPQDPLAEAIYALAQRAQQTGLFGSGWTAFRAAQQPLPAAAPRGGYMMQRPAVGDFFGSEQDASARPGATAPGVADQAADAAARLRGAAGATPFTFDDVDPSAAENAPLNPASPNGHGLAEPAAPQAADATAAGLNLFGASGGPAALDAMGLPTDPQVGQIAKDKNGDPQRFVGTDAAGARVWSGPSALEKDANAEPTVGAIVVAGGKHPASHGAVWSPAVRQRIAQAVAYYRSQGWTPEQAAGIVGNLLGENDTLDPHRREVLRRGGEGPGRGLAQWTNKARKEAFVQHFNGRDFDHTTFEEQLAYLQHELKTTERGPANEIRKGRTPEQAAAAAVLAERPADPKGAIAIRSKLARRIYDEFP